MPHDTLMPTRRDVLAGAAVVALGAAGPSWAQSTATARGIVFDAASTPRAGIPNVMVSNGLDVVKTGANGDWSLPVRDGDSVFVIKPAGWALPLDRTTNLPRFAYVHAPSGSPELGFRFAGMPATGPLPNSIDFALRRQDEPARFDAVLFTDPQPESLHEVGYIRDDVVSVVDASQAAFGITHGDIMFDDLSY